MYVTSSLFGSRQGLVRGEPLRVSLLDASDFESEVFEQEREGVGDIGVGDLDGDHDGIAGAINFFIGLEFQSGSVRGIGVSLR